MADPQQPVSNSPVERVLLALAGHRMSLWLWISVALLVAIFFLARHMIGVVVFKLSLLTIAGYVGYGLSLAVEGCLKHGEDRARRPHEYRADARQALAAGNAERGWQLEQLAAAMLWRRAMIVSACLLAAALGS